MKLFKVSVMASDVWSRFYLKKLKPIYVISENKLTASAYVSKHLKDGLKVKSVSVLGEQLGERMYSGNKF